MIKKIILMIMMFKVAVWLQQELLAVEEFDSNCSALPSLESLVIVTTIITIIIVTIIILTITIITILVIL